MGQTKTKLFIYLFLNRFSCVSVCSIVGSLINEEVWLVGA